MVKIIRLGIPPASGGNLVHQRALLAENPTCLRLTLWERVQHISDRLGKYVLSAFFSILGLNRKPYGLSVSGCWNKCPKMLRVWVSIQLSGPISFVCFLEKDWCYLGANFFPSRTNTYKERYRKLTYDISWPGGIYSIDRPGFVVPSAALDFLKSFFLFF